jgi:hypothetical protein
MQDKTSATYLRTRAHHRGSNAYAGRQGRQTGVTRSWQKRKPGKYSPLEGALSGEKETPPHIPESLRGAVLVPQQRQGHQLLSAPTLQ